MAYGLNALIIFVSYPVFLKYLGYEKLGLWATFSFIISFAEVGNLGISETMMKFLAQYYYTNNIHKLKEYINTGGLVIYFASILLFMMIIPIKDYIISLLNIPDKYIGLVGRLLPYIVLISITQMFLSYLKGILAGVGHIDVSNMLLVGTNFIRVIIMLFLLINKATLWSVASAYLTANILAIIVSLSFLRRYLGFPYLSIQHINKTVFKELVFFGGNITGSKMFTIFFIPFTKGVIARYIGLKEVGYFEISWKMIYQLRNLVQKGFIAFLPKISELYSQSNNYQIKKLVKKSFYYSIILGGIFILGIYIFGDFILKLWLGKVTNEVILHGLKILAISSAFSLLFVPHYYAILGMGRPRVILYEGIIKATTNFVILISFIALSILNYNIILFSVMISILLSSVYVVVSYQFIMIKYDK